MRFDMRAPGKTPAEIAGRYRAAVDMSRWADERGCSLIVVSEHHASDDGYLPAPLLLASAIAAVTERTPIMVGAAILPLYDPVRLAEEMIVLDHLSQGRVMYTFGLGYRPEEYELFGLDFDARGAIADEKLHSLLGTLHAASAIPPARPAGPTTTANARDVAHESDGAAPDETTEQPRVTPPPYTSGGPMITWGGASKAAARRAGRHGIGFIAQTDDPALGDAYRAAAAEHGHAPGLCVLPSPDVPESVFVHPDLDIGWREVGSALLADARAYHRWNEGTPRTSTIASLSAGTTVEELRQANGSHRVVTPEQAVDLIDRFGALALQPLCGGLDPDVAWPYLRRVVDDVVPALVSR